MKNIVKTFAAAVLGFTFLGQDANACIIDEPAFYQDPADIQVGPIKFRGYQLDQATTTFDKVVDMTASIVILNEQKTDSTTKTRPTFSAGLGSFGF